MQNLKFPAGSTTFAVVLVDRVTKHAATQSRVQAITLNVIAMPAHVCSMTLYSQNINTHLLPGDVLCVGADVCANTTFAMSAAHSSVLCVGSGACDDILFECGSTDTELKQWFVYALHKFLYFCISVYCAFFGLCKARSKRTRLRFPCRR